MTAEGKAAFDAMDAADHPANNCVSPGLPSIVMVPNLQVWELSADRLTIRHEYFDTTRTIDLLSRTHPADGEPTSGGHAIGWFEGSTLVIETAKLAATIGGLSRNAPSSDQRVVVERYALAADGNTLTGQMTINDAKYLTRPLTLPVTMERAEEGTELVTFPCDVESSRRHLD